ncbi:Predicted RNA-binding protein, contains PUA-like domain [Halopseudomonas formosensis]|uniref:Predicted RNA-binding protein, contains PUA-like domain n=1 Tax=Halopseudomonas formosensis TaxID=1002526 RepID=A0A1I6BSG4_9GAMM|nr:EVE domain-containing protein [Halopseudomonas formosensis]SFQ83865.1 Predicted RNA-binding protein, contains PUA-like domain [Halopseudomonas formosensis]
MAFWLAKTEPDECSIDDFARAPQTPIRWDGVRNFQARNYLGQMSVGDLVFIYHSSCREIGIAGIARVSTAAYPDPSQFDPSSPYHDPKSREDKPRWQAVDLIFQQRFAELLPLDSIKSLNGLDGLPLMQRGNRLSVMPVSPEQWRILLHASS